MLVWNPDDLACVEPVWCFVVLRDRVIYIGNRIVNITNNKVITICCNSIRFDYIKYVEFFQ